MADQVRPALETAGMFKKVVQDRASQVIVDQLKRLIREGRLATGDRLPSERALCQEFGVSRVTVREALRILESTGQVVIKVGANGGAFVTTPTTEQVSTGMAELITASQINAVAVTEAREVFELAVLPLVVERATDDDLDSLTRIVDEAEHALAEGSFQVEMSARFHERLAACTHNAAIEMLIRSFHGPMLSSLREAREAAPAMGHRGTKEHREIIEAIRRRDATKATAVMTAHLHRTAQVVAETPGA